MPPYNDNDGEIAIVPIQIDAPPQDAALTEPECMDPTIQTLNNALDRSIEILCQNNGLPSFAHTMELTDLLQRVLNLTDVVKANNLLITSNIVAKYSHYIYEILKCQKFAPAHLVVVTSSAEKFAYYNSKGYSIDPEIVHFLFKNFITPAQINAQKEPVRTAKAFIDLFPSLIVGHTIPVEELIQTTKVLIAYGTHPSIGPEIKPNMVKLFTDLTKNNFYVPDLIDLCVSYLGNSNYDYSLLNNLRQANEGSNYVSPGLQSAVLTIIANEDQTDELRIQAIHVLASTQLQPSAILLVVKLLQSERYSQDINHEEIVLAKAVFSLILGKNHNLKNYLTPPLINSLITMLRDEIETLSWVQELEGASDILQFIITRYSYLFKPELKQALERTLPALEQQYLVNSYITKLSTIQPDVITADSKIDEQLTTLTELLHNNPNLELANLPLVILKLAKADKALLKQCLELAKIFLANYKDAELVNQLTIIGDLSLEDISWFINQGYYSSQIRDKFTESLSDNLEELAANPAQLANVLLALANNLKNDNLFSKNILSSLISLVKNCPEQSNNILNLLLACTAKLEEEHYQSLAAAYHYIDELSVKKLETLFALAGKELPPLYTNPLSINIELQNFNNIIVALFAEELIAPSNIVNVVKNINYLATIYSQEFIRNVILDYVLFTAKTFAEFEKFLSLITNFTLSEVEIQSYLTNYQTLADINQVIDEFITAEQLAYLSNLTDSRNAREAIGHYTMLRENGWSNIALAKLIAKITDHNICHLGQVLRTIAEYRINELDRNKKGERVIDILALYPDDQLEPAIYTIASNKFMIQQENKGTVLVEKIIQLNPELASHKQEYENFLVKVHTLYTCPSEDERPIGEWSAEQVLSWAKKFKEAAVKDKLAKLMAVLQRANNLHTMYNGGIGHEFRDTQILAIYKLLHSSPDKRGTLLQIATGEGKSAISATLAAIIALHGANVDIITSSSVLANTGYKNSKGFFALLELTSDTNLERSNKSGTKPCYNANIVYGDTLSFGSDYLNNTSGNGAGRGARPFSYAVVDEVDNMLLDGSKVSVNQTSPAYLMEYLSPLMAMAWHSFNNYILAPNPEVELELAQKYAEEIIADLIDKLAIPKHLIPYAKHKTPFWAKSLIHAALVFKPNVDYVVNINDDGERVINPVDNSTGVTQESMVWKNGLQQFLQIKENCRVNSTGVTAFSVANTSFYKLYKQVLGMTGTLGSASSQDFLKTIYDLDLAFMPPHKDKQLIELPPRFESTAADVREEICNTAYREAVLHKRSTLICTSTIAEAEEYQRILASKCKNAAKIINYSRSEQKLYNRDIEQVTKPATIIIATRLGGRGTDFLINAEVASNGGLAVISDFIADSARDDDQVKGRGARSGLPGSYQVITLNREFSCAPNEAGQLLVLKKQQRDSKEQATINDCIETMVPSILAKDKLHSAFAKVYKELLQASPSQEKSSRINQFVENFGLWMAMQQDGDSVDAFLATAKVQFQENSFTNPVHAIFDAASSGADNPHKALALLDKAKDINDIYNFASYYYSAKNWLKIGPEDPTYKDQAISNLQDAAVRINEIISYLTGINIVLAGGPNNQESETLKTNTAKIRFLGGLVDHIKSVSETIAKAKDKEVRIKADKSKEQIANDLKKADLAEIEFLGVTTIFEIETYKPRQKWYDTALIACCAIVQLTIGACIAIGTMGGSTQLSVSIFTEGLMDLYKVVKSLADGEALRLDDYLTQKAVSYAIIGAQVGFSKLAAAKNAGQAAQTAALTAESAKQLAVTQTIETTVSTLSKSQLQKLAIEKLIQNSAVQIVKGIAVEAIACTATKVVQENILDGLEKSITKQFQTQIQTQINVLVQSGSSSILCFNGETARNQVLHEVQELVTKICSTSKAKTLLSQLNQGALDAVAHHSKVAAAAATGYWTLQVAKAVAKIEPIISKIQEGIAEIIIKANQQLNSRKLTNDQIRRDNTDIASQIPSADWIANITRIASNAVMNFIQRKVTMPIAVKAVGAGVDDILQDFKAQQMNEFAVVRSTLVARQELAQVEAPKLPTKPPLPPQELPPESPDDSKAEDKPKAKPILFPKLKPRELPKPQARASQTLVKLDPRFLPEFIQERLGARVSQISKPESLLAQAMNLHLRNPSGHQPAAEDNSLFTLQDDFRLMPSAEAESLGAAAACVYPANKSDNNNLRAAQFKIYINSLKAKAENLSGLEKEFAQNAIDELQKMRARAMNTRSIQEVSREVLIRNFRTGNIATPKMFLDFAGEVGALIYEKSQAFLERSDLVALTKAAASAELKMLGGRLVELVRATTSEELRVAAAKPLYELARWEEANLLPGERKIFNLVTAAATIELGAGAVGFARDAASISGKMAAKVEVGAELKSVDYILEVPKESLDSFGTRTARDVIVEKPYIAKEYLREIETITDSQLPAKQISILKQELQAKEFVKLAEEQQRLHRSEFNSQRISLREEWAKQTGKEWPTYAVELIKNGIKETKIYNYDAHHIIKLDHGGPNTWWNIHPALPTEHSQIHGSGSLARQIFDKRSKK